jgi:ribosome maturation factor RimP
VSVDKTRERLVEELTEPLLTLGLDLEGIELAAAGRRRVLRIAVDRDGGVTLDDVAAATKEISRLLDESDVMGEQPYVLEVSSPGTDRPLTHPRHWRRNAGRLVAVTTTDGASRTGRVVEAAEDRVVLEVDGDRQLVALADVTKARVQVEFNRKGGTPAAPDDEPTADHQVATDDPDPGDPDPDDPDPDDEED